MNEQQELVRLASPLSSFCAFVRDFCAIIGCVVSEEQFLL